MKKYLFVALALMAGGCSMQPYSISQSEKFNFGYSVDEMKTQLLTACDELSVREIIPITAPLAKTSQTQIDCSGFYYAGKKRNIELVFQDDQLDLVWILFPENEREDILKGFSAVYGEPSMVVDFGSMYLDINAAIRNKPSEVLFVSDRQEEAMLKILSGN